MADEQHDLAELAAELGPELQRRSGEQEALLRRLVDQPSGSHDREGVARCCGIVAETLEGLGLGLEVEVHDDDGLPRHVVGRLAARPAGVKAGPAPTAPAPRILLVGHLDTVFAKSDRRTLRMDDERFYGPGCTDMKGGLVIAFEALRAVAEQVRDRGVAVEIIVNGDEELGSPRSRELIRDRARGARAALVFENCEVEAAAITGRKGLGWARVAVEGRAAHAGINPEEGASALLEAAHQVIDAHALNDPERGVGVIVGLARGGVSRNTVPPSAELLIDLRYTDKPAAERAFAALRERAAATRIAGTAATFEGELHRPPMLEQGAAQRWIHARAAAVARAAGLPGLDALATGGGSDANLTADLGVPSIDGLGVVGGAIHTRREWGLRRSLPSRALLAALLLVDLAGAGTEALPGAGQGLSL